MSALLDRRKWMKKSALGLTAFTLPYFDTTQPDFSTDSSIVRLSHNENPYGPSPAARKAIIDHISMGNRYPRTSISELKELIAAKEGIRKEQVLITAGSTEILGLMGLIYGIQQGNIISGHPTFDYLMHYSQVFGSQWKKVPLNAQYYPLKEIEDAVNKETKLVFICNPNNPTGTYIDQKTIGRMASKLAKRTAVFIDEAYIEFTDDGIANSLAHQAIKNPNIIVGRTFSKIYGMAGLRIGYAIAHESTIEEMKRYYMGRMITPSVTSIEAAKASILDESFASKTKRLIDEAKEQVYASFDQWGVNFWKSHTNFIWFETKRFDQDVYVGLEKKQIIIRNYSHTPGFARVSIGTLPEMTQFLEQTKTLLA